MKENIKKTLWCLPFAFPVSFACIAMREPFRGFETIVYIMIGLLPVIYGLLGKRTPIVIGNLASGLISTTLVLCNPGLINTNSSGILPYGFYIFSSVMMVLVFQLCVASLIIRIIKKPLKEYVRKALIAVAAVLPAALSVITAAAIIYVPYDFNKNGITDDKYDYIVTEHYSDYLYFEGVDAVYYDESNAVFGGGSNWDYYDDHLICCESYKEENSDDIYISVRQQIFWSAYDNDYLAFTTEDQKAWSADGEELVLVPALKDDKTHKIVSGCFVDDSELFSYHIYDSRGKRLTINDLDEYFPINVRIKTQAVCTTRTDVF